jgi:hypothetical protein
MRLLFGALFFIIWPIFAKRQTENETTQKAAKIAVHEKVVRNSTLLTPSAESKREPARILVAYSLDEDSHLGSLMPMINRWVNSKLMSILASMNIFIIIQTRLCRTSSPHPSRNLGE